MSLFIEKTVFELKTESAGSITPILVIIHKASALYINHFCYSKALSLEMFQSLACKKKHSGTLSMRRQNKMLQYIALYKRTELGHENRFRDLRTN